MPIKKKKNEITEWLDRMKGNGTRTTLLWITNYEWNLFINDVDVGDLVFRFLGGGGGEFLGQKIVPWELELLVIVLFPIAIGVHRCSISEGERNSVCFFHGNTILSFFLYALVCHRRFSRQIPSNSRDWWGRVFLDRLWFVNTLSEYTIDL